MTTEAIGTPVLFMEQKSKIQNIRENNEKPFTQDEEIELYGLQQQANNGDCD